MPTGTKIAAIVAVVLLAAAGLYYAFVAPATPGGRTPPAPVSGGVNGLSSQSPSTLAPAPTPLIPTVGAPPSSASSTPAIGTLGQGPTPTGLPAGTGASSGREQPGFAPGSLSSATGGKGDIASPSAAPALVNGFPVGSSPSAVPGSNSSGSNSGVGSTPAPVNTAAPASATARATPAEGGPRPTQSGPAGVVPSSPVSPGAPAVPASTPSTRPAAAPTSGETTHTVASGDTLSAIAKRYLGSENAWRSIAKANPSVDPTAMKVGTKLKIPARETVATSTGTSPSSGSSSGSSGASASGSNPSSTNLHVVASGDTLASIARRYYGNSKHWQKIYDANRGVIGSDPAALKIGQRLNLPAKTVVVGGENVER